MFVTIEPMPISEPTRAAIEVLAPRSNALSAMTGIIEPSARPNRVAGAYAATAIERRRNSLTSASHGPRHPGTGTHEGGKEEKAAHFTISLAEQTTRPCPRRTCPAPVRRAAGRRNVSKDSAP